MKISHSGPVDMHFNLGLLAASFIQVLGYVTNYSSKPDEKFGACVTLKHKTSGSRVNAYLDVKNDGGFKVHIRSLDTPDYPTILKIDNWTPKTPVKVSNSLELGPIVEKQIIPMMVTQWEHYITDKK